MGRSRHRQRALIRKPCSGAIPTAVRSLTVTEERAPNFPDPESYRRRNRSLLRQHGTAALFLLLLPLNTREVAEIIRALHTGALRTCYHGTISYRNSRILNRKRYRRSRRRTFTRSLNRR